MSNARKIRAKRVKRELRVVHCKRDTYDVLIDRTTIWGNPFVIGVDGTREEVIAKYRRRLQDNDELRTKAELFLRGKVLGCWCAPKACHGDVLWEIANKPKTHNPAQVFAKRGPPTYRCTENGEVWASWRGLHGGTVLKRIR